MNTISKWIGITALALGMQGAWAGDYFQEQLQQESQELSQVQLEQQQRQEIQGYLADARAYYRLGFKLVGFAYIDDAHKRMEQGVREQAQTTEQSEAEMVAGL